MCHIINVKVWNHPPAYSNVESYVGEYFVVGAPRGDWRHAHEEFGIVKGVKQSTLIGKPRDSSHSL